MREVVAGMVIVSGYLVVATEDREAYLDGCRDVVRQARQADGCLDYALSADLVEPGRINILERWATQSAVEAFRGDGVGDEQGQQILTASVAEYEVAEGRPLS